MRRLHRWVSIIAVVFLLNQSITGMLLAWENISEQFYDGAEHTDHPTSFTDAEVVTWMQEAYRQAREATPQAPIIAISLSKNDGEAFSPVFFGGEHGGAIGFKLTQHYYIFGKAGPATPGDAAIDKHSFLKRIHRGDVIGHFSGRYLTIAAGLCLLWLVFSGIYMYCDMVRKRRQAGRKALFWW